MRPYELTALELTGQLRTGAVTQTKVISTAVGRIIACQSGNNAFITVANSPAPAPAPSASPLAGVPMAYKDNLYTRGIRITCASKVLGDFTPCYDVTAMERPIAAGAVSMGRLDPDEFAMGSTCETSYYDPVESSQDLARSLGGSSGEVTATVAAGEIWYAVSSDTGGSIHQPAARYGATDVKPTYGSMSRYDLVTYASFLDQLSLIAHSAAGCAAAPKLLRRRGPWDVISLGPPTEGPLYVPTDDVRDRRIGPPAECLGGALKLEMATVAQATTGVLRVWEAVAEECSPPLLGYATSTYYILACVETPSNLARFNGIKFDWRAEGCGSLGELCRRTHTGGFGSEVKRRILLGTLVLSAGCYDSCYRKALQARARLKAAFGAVFQGHDLLLIPVASTTAPRLGEDLADPLSLYLSDTYTVPTSLAGLPALSVPYNFDRNGLPTGAQFIGPALGDLTMLDAAHAYQQEID